jgi:hypothetical protein
VGQAGHAKKASFGTKCALAFASACLVFGNATLVLAGLAPQAAAEGPDLPACDLSSSVQGQTTTLTLSAPGSGCTWTPPAGISSATVTLFGAQGGDGGQDPNFDFADPGPGGTGGLGSEVAGTLSGIEGRSFELNVGGGGTDSSQSSESQVGNGSSNGGGAGTLYGGDGGGGTDLRAGAFNPSDRILVAGGGGGGGSSEASSAGGNGGDGDTNGSNGPDNEDCAGSGGLGGFAGNAPAPHAGVGGGGGSVVCAGYVGNGFSGSDGASDGTGGNGSTSMDTGTGGGGGGGGYMGGGGGGQGVISDNDGVASSADGGGGGGSSYTGGADGLVPTATSVTDPVSPAAPNGFIRIVFSVAVSTTTAPPTTTTTTQATTTTTTTAHLAATPVAPAAVPPAAAPQLAVTGIEIWDVLSIASILIGMGMLLLLLPEIRRSRWFGLHY